MAHKRIFMIHKQHAVCFRCRIALKEVTVCPHCRQPMISTGLKAPRRSNVREWKRLYEEYKPMLETRPEAFKVQLTHNDEYEREHARDKYGTTYIFSRKLTARKKKSK